MEISQPVRAASIMFFVQYLSCFSVFPFWACLDKEPGDLKLTKYWYSVLFQWGTHLIFRRPFWSSVGAGRCDIRHVGNLHLLRFMDLAGGLHGSTEIARGSKLKTPELHPLTPAQLPALTECPP